MTFTGDKRSQRTLLSIQGSKSIVTGAFSLSSPAGESGSCVWINIDEAVETCLVFLV